MALPTLTLGPAASSLLVSTTVSLLSFQARTSLYSYSPAFRSRSHSYVLHTGFRDTTVERIAVRRRKQPDQLHAHLQPALVQLQRVMRAKPSRKAVHVLRPPARSAIHAGCAREQLRRDATGNTEHLQRNNPKCVDLPL